jgi:hypothetical protein
MVWRLEDYRAAGMPNVPPSPPDEIEPWEFPPGAFPRLDGGDMIRRHRQGQAASWLRAAEDGLGWVSAREPVCPAQGADL